MSRRPTLALGATALMAVLSSGSLPAQTPARPDACAGHWTGSIQLPTGALAFDVDLTRDAAGACAGDISIPQQGARDLPLTGVRVAGDSLRFTIGGVPGAPTFAGVRQADASVVTGSFTQGTGRLTFEMRTAASPAAAAREALAGFEAWVDSALVQWRAVGTAVGIVVDGEVVYLKGHGLRDRDRKLPVTTQTLFAIGSSSKAFTTFAMGKLADEGRLQWDVPLRTYLPWFRMHDEGVAAHLTPRDLVTHRSGLPRHDLLWYNNTTATREELVRRIAYLPLSADLRERFQYNNLMFLTAGYLVGTRTGKSWEDGIRELVLAPLGMGRTNFSVAESQRDADHALPYRTRGDTVERIPFRDISLVGPAGSINSTIEDMTKWVGLHLAGGKIGDRQVVSASTLKDMYRPYTPIAGLGDEAELGPMSYGLGWFITTYRGHYRVDHGGNIDGFSAGVTMFPTDRIGIVVLTNQNGSALPNLITRHAADRLLGAERRNWSGEALGRRDAGDSLAKRATANREVARVKGTRPGRPLADFAGTYADSGYGTATVSLVRDTLELEYHGIRAKLRHWHYDTFLGLRNPDDPTFENVQVTFRTAPDGSVEGALVPAEPAVAPTFFLRQPDPRLSDAAHLARYAGRYAVGPLQFTVEVRGNRLWATQNTSPPFELEPMANGGFRPVLQRAVQLVFVEDPAGTVTGLQVRQPNGVLEAKRQKP